MFMRTFFLVMYFSSTFIQPPSFGCFQKVVSLVQNNEWLIFLGLYLFLQIQFPLSLVHLKRIFCFTLGWGEHLLIYTEQNISVEGFPSVLMLVWYVMKKSEEVVDTGSRSSYDCIILTESSADLFAYKVPVFVLLALNSACLFWIMLVDIVKAKSKPFRIIFSW